MDRFWTRLAPYLFAGTALTGACASQKNIKTITLIHGPEYAADTVGMHKDMEAMRHIVEDNPKKIPGAMLGNGVVSVKYGVIGKRMSSLKKQRVQKHNIALNFHGGVVKDSTDAHFFVRDNALENCVNDTTEGDLMASKLYATIGNNLRSPFRKYDAIEIINYACHALSGVGDAGNLPGHSFMWMSADSTFDYQDNLVQSFRREKPWDALGADHFITAHLMLQNATVGYSDTHQWNHGGYIAIVTDRRERRNHITIDNKTKHLGQHEVRIIDLERDVLRLATDFTADEIQEASRPVRALIPAMLQAACDKKLSARALKNYVPSDSVLRRHDFDKNLVDITLAKMVHVHDRKSFQTLLTDPEQRTAYAITAELFCQKKNWDKAEPLPDFIRERQITQRRHPRYEGNGFTYSHP